jgi:hypothetical protein
MIDTTFTYANYRGYDSPIYGLLHRWSLDGVRKIVTAVRRCCWHIQSPYCQLSRYPSRKHLLADFPDHHSVRYL